MGPKAAPGSEVPQSEALTVNAGSVNAGSVLPPPPAVIYERSHVRVLRSTANRMRTRVTGRAKDMAQTGVLKENLTPQVHGRASDWDGTCTVSAHRSSHWRRTRITNY